MAVTRPIVGRTEELAVIDRFLRDARVTPTPRALMIEGEAGIGKTALLEVLTNTARQRGVSVLSCRPSPSESDLSYAGLTDLLAVLDDRVIDALPGPQAKVIRMVLRREEGEERFDRLSLYVAVGGVIRALGAERPLLIVVDDLQWLDQPTARALTFVMRRLTETAARLVVVRRPGETAQWLDELVRSVPDDCRDVLTPASMEPGELARVLRRTLGWAPAWPRVVKIAELSRGNPLHALELTRAVGDPESGVDLDGPLPDTVLDLARARIALVPAPVREALELASVPRVATLGMLEQLAPRGVDPGPAIAQAERLGVLASDGGRLRFTHPIFAAAVYGSIPAARRRRLHREVAMLVTDLEERARHLARACDGPDADVAKALAEAAEQAWRRGAPAAAADLLRLACARTPPTDVETLADRGIAYGRLLHGAGDAPGAIKQLQTLADTLPSGLIRARALYHLMYVKRLSGILAPAMEDGVRAAADAAGHPLFQAEIYELLSRFSDNDIQRKLDAARRGVAAVGQAPDPDPYVLFHIQAALVEAEFYAGLGVHLEYLTGLDPGNGRRFPPVRTAVACEDLIGRLLTFDGRVDEGLRLLRGMYDRALVKNRASLPAVLGWMAEAELMAGRFAAALEHTRAAIEHAEQVGTVGGNPWESGFHSVALAMLGRLDEAEAVGAAVVSRAEADPAIDMDSAPALLGLGIAALARGHHADAATHLRRLDRAKQEAGIREPRFCAHVSDLIEALVGEGDLAAADAVLARLKSEARSSGGRWSLAAAARGEAMVCAARGRIDDALAAVDEALELFACLPAPFERARTLLVAGQIRRRRREKSLARQALTEALEEFTALQTPVWAERARAELSRIPPRHSGTALTPTELTIARLVTEGLTNREIADRAFVSPKTVEANLTRIYRKLSVRSRAALAGRLAQAEPPPPDPVNRPGRRAP